MKTKESRSNIILNETLYFVYIGYIGREWAS